MTDSVQREISIAVAFDPRLTRTARSPESPTTTGLSAPTAPNPGAPEKLLSVVDQMRFAQAARIAPAVAMAFATSAFPNVLDPYSERLRLRRKRSSRVRACSPV